MRSISLSGYRAFVLHVATRRLHAARHAQPAAPKVVADANAPKGKLPDTARRRAYRLDFTVLPEAARFSGHDEIDVKLNQPAKSLYMHGRDLAVTRAVAVVGGKTVPAKWTQVDKTGTARLDFAQRSPGRQRHAQVRLQRAVRRQRVGHVPRQGRRQMVCLDAVRKHRRARRLPWLRRARIQDAVHGLGDDPSRLCRRRQCARSVGDQGRRRAGEAPACADQAAADLSRRGRHRPVRAPEGHDRARRRALDADALRRRRDAGAEGQDGLCDGGNAAHRQPARKLFRRAVPLSQARPDRHADHAGRDGECRRRHLRRQHHLSCSPARRPATSRRSAWSSRTSCRTNGSATS